MVSYPGCAGPRIEVALLEGGIPNTLKSTSACRRTRSVPLFGYRNVLQDIYGSGSVDGSTAGCCLTAPQSDNPTAARRYHWCHRNPTFADMTKHAPYAVVVHRRPFQKLSVSSSRAHFVFLAARALADFFLLLLIITMARKVPTTAEPRRVRMTGIRIAQTRGGKRL